MTLEVYKIETLGALDGPGLRIVVFLQGCPIRCGYCHNADSWQSGEGTLMTSEEIFKRIMRMKPYFQDAGGVTFSGGEPLLQATKLLPLVQRLKVEGIHVALDTSGSISSDAAKELIKAVDLVILDIKGNDDENYRKLTQHGIEKPLKTLYYLKEIHKPYWIRQVILKGINDDVEHLRHLEALTRDKMREKLELLPYHEMGNSKWTERQEHYFGNFEVPNRQSMHTLCNWVENTLKSLSFKLIPYDEEFPNGAVFGLKDDSCLYKVEGKLFPDIRQDWMAIDARIQPLIDNLIKEIKR